MAKKHKQINPYPLGAHPEGKKIKFSFVSSKKSCGVYLYDRESGELIRKVPFSEKEKVGNIFCKQVSVPEAETIAYQFYEDDTVCTDRRARAFTGKKVFGNKVCEEEMKAVFAGDGVGGNYFPWDGDICPKIPYEDCIAYCLHVRGFTIHPSSEVEHKGTFAGLREKIPYLKESGITTVELQPAYEFIELPEENTTKGMDAPKLNYWGYKEGYYYTPKSGYAAGEDAVYEFKDMIKSFHKEGLEIVMQFYFPKDFAPDEILEILRFWVLEYHVDGFHLIGEEIPAQAVAKEPLLADTKLWCRSFDADNIYGKHVYGENSPGFCHLAEYNDDYNIIEDSIKENDVVSQLEEQKPNNSYLILFYKKYIFYYTQEEFESFKEWFDLKDFNSLSEILELSECDPKAESLYMKFLLRLIIIVMATGRKAPSYSPVLAQFT